MMLSPKNNFPFNICPLVIDGIFHWKRWNLKDEINKLGGNEDDEVDSSSTEGGRCYFDASSSILAPKFQLAKFFILLMIDQL